MKKLTVLLGALGAALLLNSAASAQTAINQSSINQKSIDKSKRVYQEAAGELSPLLQFYVRREVTPPPGFIEHMVTSNAGTRLAMEADKEAAAGDWPQAQSDYQEALVLDPYDMSASYALGDDKVRHGDLKAAVDFYRKAIYCAPTETSPKVPLVSAPVLQESNAFRLMEFARLLSLTGHPEEAQAVYKRGAHFVNYIDGHPQHPLLLPDFGPGPDQVPFTPARLQALAQVGWAEDHSDFDIAGAKKRLQEAIALYPDSPVPYFFRGRYEMRQYGDFAAADADFDQAQQLGNPAVDEAVQKERDVFRYQFDAARQATQQDQPAPKPKQAGQ